MIKAQAIISEIFYENYDKPFLIVQTVATHNSDIFLRPKKVSLFWEMSLCVRFFK